VFERRVVGGKPAFRQLRREQPVARGVSDMERLGHRAEIGFDPARKRSGDRERLRGGARIEPHQMTARRRRAEHTQCRGRVPALFVMVIVDAAADPRLRLEPGDISGDEIAAAAILRLGHRKDRRQDRRRGVPAQRIADIVEIERVRRGAVDERRVERAGAPVAAKDQAGARRAAQRVGDDARAILMGAREGDADRVEDGRLRPMDRLARQRVVADGDDLLGDLFDQCHGNASSLRAERGNLDPLWPPRQEIASSLRFSQ
jgi:hypothetical protein